MINIVHLIPHLGHGGAENVVINIYKRIDKRKFNIKILYWGKQNDLISQNNKSNEEIIKLNIGNVISKETIFSIVKHLKNFDAHIIQTHLIDSDLIGFIASKLVKIPHLITIHSYPFPYKRRHCFRYKLMSIFSEKLICVSDTVKNYVVSKTKINPEKISVVYNGIDLKRYSKNNSDQVKQKLKRNLGIDSHNKVIGNVSRLIEDKGHKYLLMSIPKILEFYPEAKFLIVGDGVLKTDLINLSKELKIEKNVIFAGERSDIPDLIDIMDVFVFPTFNEALGICVIEAMSMGKPIIATNDAAIPELICSNKEGILISPGNHKAISEAIINLLCNPPKCREFSEAAKKRANEFSINNMVSKIENIYQAILKK